LASHAGRRINAQRIACVFRVAYGGAKMSDLSASAPQRSDAWHAERRGKITASNVWKILPGKRGGYLAARQSYLYGLAAERVGVQLPTPYVTAAMERGIALEPAAREALAFELSATIEQVGFCRSSFAGGNAGASPDGIITRLTVPDLNIGHRSLVELKCPEAIEFIRFAIGGEIDPDHYAQIHLGMMVTGLNSAYIACYHPEFPRPLVARCVWRDEEYCAKLQAEIEKAEIEICEIVRRLS
jgi:hypothetical protein